MLTSHRLLLWLGLGRFLGSQWDRQLKFSAYASFLISWSLSKFELIIDNFFFIVSKEGSKEKNSETKKSGKLQLNELLVHFPFWNLDMYWCRKCITLFTFDFVHTHIQILFLQAIRFINWKDGKFSRVQFKFLNKKRKI